jgi:hypothetical protein
MLGPIFSYAYTGLWNGACCFELRHWRMMMAQDLSRAEERRGTRRLMLAGGVLAAFLLVAVVLWPLVVDNKLGIGPGGADQSRTPDLTTSRGTQVQRAAESSEGKNNPAGQEDGSGARARQIRETSQPLQLTDEQRQKVRQIIAKENAPKEQKVDFELMIGTAVPRQARLQDIPPEITQLMNGYWGDQYLLAGDTMIIVDHQSRRVVAIVPGVA